MKLIGNPTVMRLCTTYGLPGRRLMRLVHKLLANLTDQHDGDAYDRLINALSRIAPQRDLWTGLGQNRSGWLHTVGSAARLHLRDEPGRIPTKESSRRAGQA